MICLFDYISIKRGRKKSKKYKSDILTVIVVYMVCRIIAFSLIPESKNQPIGSNFCIVTLYITSNLNINYYNKKGEEMVH